MGLGVNILTSGFLVSVVVFFLLMGILFYTAYSKVGQILLAGNNKENNLEQLNSALSSLKTAYILGFIAAGMTLILAILYAGHETIVQPSELWHGALYLTTFILLIISVIYAFIALNKINDVTVRFKNGADSYIWAGLLMSIFGFVGLTATSTGRLGMNIVRTNTRERVEKVESAIHEHLPAIRQQVETHLPTVRDKVDQLHETVKNTADV